MKNYLFKNAKFCTTATNEKQYPVLKADSGELLPEVAVAGRSNVGKSSLLNHLFHAKGLVKTSSTPGKTQAMNFFTVNNELAFVDLPGYGYAEVPMSVRKQWGPMVQEYLQKREQLKLILFLFDIRRRPNDEDREFIDWVAQNEKSMILVLTKVDKVTQNEKRAYTKKILEEFYSANLHYVHYSVVKNLGHKELSHMISEAIYDESKEEDGSII
jgi:GTP-binding protein